MSASSPRRFPLPPADMILSVGGGDFDEIGKHIFELITKHGGIAKDAKVLDIGSGCGRVAIPLVDYLDASGTYDGIDVVKEMVDWSANHITTQDRRFRFHHADLGNTLYNQSSQKASTYRFPFPDETFDFAFATSVFTHLNSEDSENYLREIRRVLKPSGKAFVTFYLLNQTYRKYRPVGLAKVTFDHGQSPYWVHDPAVPEAVSAYDEAYAFDMIRSAGLDIVTVSYGGWIQCKGWSFQDCLVLRPSRSLVPV